MLQGHAAVSQPHFAATKLPRFTHAKMQQGHQFQRHLHSQLPSPPPPPPFPGESSDVNRDQCQPSRIMRASDTTGSSANIIQVDHVSIWCILAQLPRCQLRVSNPTRFNFKWARKGECEENFLAGLVANNRLFNLGCLK